LRLVFLTFRVTETGEYLRVTKRLTLLGIEAAAYYHVRKNSEGSMHREHILAEIRRTTAENGGRPLGSRKFTLETGIRYADWYGKIWARWSDALTEAGFAPNQLQEAFDDQWLIELYAKVASELGRLPSQSDLKLKHHRDRDFPDAKVFERLGTKAELVQHVLDFCRGNDVYHDAALLCEAYTPRGNRAAVDKTSTNEDAIGYVYLIRSGRFHKVGRSNAAGRRAYELAIQLPERAEMVHAIRTDDPVGIEAYWHRRFDGKRKNGEWFELDKADVAAFKRRKSFM
jgi:hypothetical protein